jgi:micrococcal nuclease
MKNILVYTFGLLLLTSVATAESTRTYQGEVTRIIDGDTFEAVFDIWPGLTVTTYIRPLGMDTPELRGKCDEEKALAREARSYAERLLMGKAVYIENPIRGKYAGRHVATVFFYQDGGYTSFANVMIASGLAREYDGGKRESWCE